MKTLRPVKAADGFMNPPRQMWLAKVTKAGEIQLERVQVVIEPDKNALNEGTRP
jgi:hypothetical protein